MGKFVVFTLLELDGETEEEYRYVEVLPKNRDLFRLVIGPILIGKNVFGRNPPKELTLTLHEPSCEEVDICLVEE